MATETIPKTMHAWEGTVGGKHPRRIEAPVPEIASDQVLVRIVASGVCHSDGFILNYPGQIPGFKPTFIMGHEGSGVIVKTGDKVTDPTLKNGQNVAILCTAGCNKSSCGECSRGHNRLCATGPNPGLGSDGMFSQYVALNTWAVVPLPENVSLEIAAVAADAVSTAYHAVKVEANIQPEHTVAIIGLGGVGFNALQIALSLKPKRIIVQDTRQEVLDEAIKLGVAKEDALLVGQAKLEEKVATEGIAIDSIIDFVGNDATFLSGQLSVRPCGTIVLVGLFGQQLPLISLAVVMKSVDIRCMYNCTRQDLIESLNLLARGVITPKIELGSIKDLPEVLENLEAGKVKSRMVLKSDF